MIFAPEIPSKHKQPQQFRMPIIHVKPILSSKLATINPCIHSLILARGILSNNNKIQRYNDDTISKGPADEEFWMSRSHALFCLPRTIIIIFTPLYFD